MTQRLTHFGERMLAWLYRRMVDDSSRHGMTAGYIYLPMVVETPELPSDRAQIDLARASGFVVLDLSDVYAGSDRQSLWVADRVHLAPGDGPRCVGRLLGEIHVTADGEAHPRHVVVIGGNDARERDVIPGRCLREEHALDVGLHDGHTL